jgi:hypothetical protein
MVNLDTAAVQAWFDRLPDDARSAMPDGVDGDETIAMAFVGAVGKARDAADVLAAVETHQDSLARMGRARRIRFLAWFAARAYPQDTKAFDILTGKDSGDDDGSLGIAAPIFRQDIEALVMALGPRAARQIVGPESLGLVAGAGYEVASELEMKQGGAI